MLGPDSYEELNVNSVPHAQKFELRVWFKVGTVTSMSLVDVALHYIVVVQMRCLCIIEYSRMDLCDFECDE